MNNEINIEALALNLAAEFVAQDPDGNETWARGDVDGLIAGSEVEGYGDADWSDELLTEVVDAMTEKGARFDA